MIYYFFKQVWRAILQLILWWPIKPPDEAEKGTMSFTVTPQPRKQAMSSKLITGLRYTAAVTFVNAAGAAATVDDQDRAVAWTVDPPEAAAIEVAEDGLSAVIVGQRDSTPGETVTVSAVADADKDAGETRDVTVTGTVTFGPDEDLAEAQSGEIAFTLA